MQKNLCWNRTLKPVKITSKGGQSLSGIKGKQVINNAKWIIVCKIIQSLLQLVVGRLCARYLGPSNYGLINYAASIVAFALPIMKLGLDSTLVHTLIESPEKEGEIMGTSLVMTMLSSIVCIGGVSFFASVVNVGETETVLVCVLYSISIFFAAVEMIQYWFQYKLQSKYSSVVMLISYIVVSLYRVYLLVTAKNVYWFAITHSIEYGIIGISLILIYLKNGNLRFCFSFERAKQMFSRSKHYILASLMVVVYQSTDHIMLTTMVSEEENGYYTAAITTAGVLQFVYIAIVDSFRPMILARKKENSPEYKPLVSGLYSIIIYLALAQSAFFAVFSELIITVLYGENYIPSVAILRIFIWFIVFSYMGIVRNVWILSEQKQKYLWFINLSGALFNVVLNAVLISYWGACGAAFASLMTQIFTNFILGFLIKPIRENNVLLLKGLNPKFVISEGKKLIPLLLNKE